MLGGEDTCVLEMWWPAEQPERTEQQPGERSDLRVCRRSGAERTLILRLPFPAISWSQRGSSDSAAWLIRAAQLGAALDHSRSISYLITPLATGLSPARRQPSGTSPAAIPPGSHYCLTADEGITPGCRLREPDQQTAGLVSESEGLFPQQKKVSLWIWCCM